MGHELQDRVSLEMASRIAAALPQHPEWVELARENLKRWSLRNRNAPSLLRCYSEWSALLERPADEIRSILTEESDTGRRLRQNSPFAGALSPQEVWDIKERARHEARSA
jgi:hypothetical protein